MKKYVSPTLNTFSQKVLLEMIGPMQAQSVTLNAVRGTHLLQETNYKHCKLIEKVDEEVKIFNINKTEGTENA